MIKKYILFFNRSRFLYKLVTCILVWIFCMYSICGNTFADIVRTDESIGVRSASSASSESPDYSLIDQIKIPQTLGTLKDVYKGKSDKTVIHIQDAHCNYSCQQKIALILDILYKKWGFSAINLEGGDGYYDLLPFMDIDHLVVRKKTAEYFLKQGILSGAEYFGILNERSTKLYGVENIDLYLNNLNAYKRIVSYQLDALAKIEKIETIFKELKNSIYSEDLLKIDNAFRDYELEKINFIDYVILLFETAEKYNVDISDKQQLHQLQKVLSLEQKQDFKLSQIQRDQIVDSLNEKLPKFEIENLLLKTLDFKNENITPFDFYSYIFQKAKTYRIQVQEYEELLAYYHYLQAYEQINENIVLEQINDLYTKIILKIMNNDKQKELFELSDYLQYLKKLFLIKITSEEFMKFKKYSNIFSMKDYSVYIKANSPENTIFVNQDALTLDAYISETLEFYGFFI